MFGGPPVALICLAKSLFHCALFKNILVVIVNQTIQMVFVISSVIIQDSLKCHIYFLGLNLIILAKKLINHITSKFKTFKSKTVSIHGGFQTICHQKQSLYHITQIICLFSKIGFANVRQKVVRQD